MYKRQPEETQQAIEIEQICFPPNEACSPKSLTERIKATAETFLVAEDKETGKLAAFLNGVPTDEGQRRRVGRHFSAGSVCPRGLRNLHHNRHRDGNGRSDDHC